MKSFNVNWCHSTRCPKSNQELFLSCCCMFCGLAVGEVIPCCVWSPIYKLLLLLNHSSVSYKWPSLESYDVAVYGFLCFRHFTCSNFADISIFYPNFRILRVFWHVWSARKVIIFLKSINLPFFMFCSMSRYKAVMLRHLVGWNFNWHESPLCQIME